MWWEKDIVLFLTNLIIGLIFIGILYFSFGIGWQLPIIIFLYVISNIYNSIVFYNVAIDKTVVLLGKYYADAIKKEINEVVKKVMKYQGPNIE
jgi:hypothetical protein